MYSIVWQTFTNTRDDDLEVMRDDDLEVQETSLYIHIPMLVHKQLWWCTVYTCLCCYINEYEYIRTINISTYVYHQQHTCMHDHKYYIRRPIPTIILWGGGGCVWGALPICTGEPRVTFIKLICTGEQPHVTFIKLILHRWTSCHL